MARFARSLSLLVLGCAALGCRETPPSKPTAPSSPSSADATSVLAEARAQQAITRHQGQPAIAARIHLAYERKRHKAPPKGFPADLLALVPPDLEHKIVRLELRDQMDRGMSAPGMRSSDLVLVTPVGRARLQALLRPQLEKAGWVRQGAALTKVLTDKAGRRLEWSIRVWIDRPTRLELGLVEKGPPRPISTVPLPNLTDYPPPLPSSARPVGFEYGRYDAGGPKAKVNDVERLAIAYRTANPESARALAVEAQAAARKMGYQDPKKPSGPMTHPDGHVFTTRVGRPTSGDVVLYHQRRRRLPAP